MMAFSSFTHDMAMLPSYLIMGLSVAFVTYLVISATMAYWTTRGK